jgi:NAD(P)-dependent dehydrogenase (short-subunit alcohol dehydrogenase family)
MVVQQKMNAFAPGVAVITGGASGIGAALAKRLALSGTRVVIADVSVEGAQAVATQIGHAAEAKYLDVSDEAQTEALFAEIASNYHRLDLVITCAGIASHGELHEFPLSHWRGILDTNLMGTIHASLAAYAIMRQQGSGTIVNLGSLSSLFNMPFCAPYCTSKAGVSAFSLSLAIEASGYGVDVTLACPGNVRTPMLGWNISAFTPAISAEDAAVRILKGVARKRRIIVFPFYARIFWYIERLSPRFLDPLRRAIIRRTSRRKLAGAGE